MDLNGAGWRSSSRSHEEAQHGSFSLGNLVFWLAQGAVSAAARFLPLPPLYFGCLGGGRLSRWQAAGAGRQHRDRFCGHGGFRGPGADTRDRGGIGVVGETVSPSHPPSLD